MQVEFTDNTTISLRPETVEDMEFLLSISEEDAEVSFGDGYSDISLWSVPENKPAFIKISEDIGSKLSEFNLTPPDTHARCANLDANQRRLTVWYNTAGFEISGHLYAEYLKDLTGMYKEELEEPEIVNILDLHELHAFINYMNNKSFSGTIEVVGGGDSGCTYISLEKVQEDQQIPQIIESDEYKKFSGWLEEWSYTKLSGIDWYNNEGGQATGTFTYDPSNAGSFTASFNGNINNEDSESYSVCWPETKHDQLAELNKILTV